MWSRGVCAIEAVVATLAVVVMVAMVLMVAAVHSALGRFLWDQ